MKKLLVLAARYQLDVPHIVTCVKFSLRTGVIVAASHSGFAQSHGVYGSPTVACDLQTSANCHGTPGRDTFGERENKGGAFE